MMLRFLFAVLVSTAAVVVVVVPTTAAEPFPRTELEEMMNRWVGANQNAESVGDWSTTLSQFYTVDAVYSWNMGPNREFVATGREEIRDVALGYFMVGFENWKYPYYDIIIDDQRGTVIAFWKQIAPGKRRTDGTNYEVDGICGSWFEYAGNYQWKWQKDFFDMGNVMDLTFQLAGAGLLEDGVKEKMANQARGKSMPLVQSLRPDPSVWTRMKNALSVTYILIFGS